MTLVGEILAIGDELIHGALLDTNSKYIAGELERLGVLVHRFSVTSDDPDQLRSAIVDACSRADIVVATGGLGPTLDDRTRDLCAEVLGGPLWFDAASWQQVQGWLAQRGRPVPDSNRRQAMFPPGAEPIPNPVGTAPGFAVTIRRARCFALPGVPREMQVMLADRVLPAVAAMPGLTPLAQVWLRVLGPSEAALGEVIERFMVPGRDPAVGITASGGLLTIRIVGTGATRERAAAACETTAAELRPLLGRWLFAEGAAELPELVLQRLQQDQCTVALAESCTGGLLASRLTDLPGASAVLQGGVIAYSNASKQALLGVPEALLAAHGAVSEPVAMAMARGVRERFGSVLGIATTGIAGPTGAVPGKPVGTVCFAIAVAPGGSVPGAGSGGDRAWTVAIPDLGRAFVRDRAVFEVWRALLQRGS
jgi:nicotinamide-nucleotide amidase